MRAIRTAAMLAALMLAIACAPPPKLEWPDECPIEQSSSFDGAYARACDCNPGGIRFVYKRGELAGDKGWYVFEECNGKRLPFVRFTKAFPAWQGPPPPLDPPGPTSSTPPPATPVLSAGAELEPATTGGAGASDHDDAAGPPPEPPTLDKPLEVGPVPEGEPPAARPGIEEGPDAPPGEPGEGGEVSP